MPQLSAAVESRSLSDAPDEDPMPTGRAPELSHVSACTSHSPHTSASTTETFASTTETFASALNTDAMSGSRAEVFDEDNSEDDETYEAARATTPSPPTMPDSTVAAPQVSRTLTQAHLAAEEPPSLPPIRRRRHRGSWPARLLAFFGYGPENKARRALLSIVWRLTIDLAQIIAIIVLLAYSTHHRSPRAPDMNEWTACGKPLGIWDSLWAGRLALNVALTCWRWLFERASSRPAVSADLETDARNASPGARRLTRGPTPPRRRPVAAPSGTADANTATNGEGRDQKAYPQWYSRAVMVRSIFTLVWFVLAHVFEYTSTNTCRFSAPHLWWLTFALLCIQYIGIIEVLAIAIVVFIIGPIVFLFWNILLLCIGRHPLQNPHYIKPDIGKLSKTVVDAIPLVIYIPPPPETEETSDAKDSNKPIASPPTAYSYPPKPSPPPPPPRRRFRFLRLKRKRRTAGGGKAEGGKEGATDEKDAMNVWEDKWEKGEFPFVRLENNRAACAICLMDFEAPRRLDAEGNEQSVLEVQEVEAAPVSTDPVSSGGHAGGRGALQLEDAGEGVQPLRLLECGHVFHKTCLDPWLIDVSGRCPVCQRPVEPPEEPEDKKERRRRRRQERRAAVRGGRAASNL